MAYNLTITQLENSVSVNFQRDANGSFYFLTGMIRNFHESLVFAIALEREFWMEQITQSIFGERNKEFRVFSKVIRAPEISFSSVVELTRLNSLHMVLQFNKFLQLITAFFSFPASYSVLLWLVKTSLFAQIFLNLIFLNLM